MTEIMSNPIETWLAANIIWVATIVFGAGGFVWSVRSLGKKIDHINVKFDELHDRDREHDHEIAELKAEVAVHGEKLRVLDHLVDRIDDIWKYVMRGNGNVK